MVSPLSSRLLGIHNADGSMPSQLPLAQLQKVPPDTTVTNSASTSTTRPSTGTTSTSVPFPFMSTFQPPAFNAVNVQPVLQTQALSLPQSQPKPTALASTHAQTSKETNTSTNAEPKSGIRRHTATRHVPILPNTSRYCPIRPRVSGYSADQESSLSSSSANSNQFSNGDTEVNVTKAMRAQEVAELSKKRKLEEMNYAALTVKEALQKGGKSYEYVLKGRARALPSGSVDMSKVQLVSAAEYDEHIAPLQAAKGAASTSVANSNSASTLHDSLSSSFSMYDALMNGTRHFYKGVCGSSNKNATLDDPLPGPSSSKNVLSSLATVATTAGRGLRGETSITTPSTSSSDSECDGSEGAVVEVAPRLEKGSMSDDKMVALRPSPPAVDVEGAKASTTLEMALSYSPKAR